MKNLAFFFLFILLFTAAAGQRNVAAFGEISKEDLQLKDCSFEPGAQAMKIFDIQEIEFKPSDYSSKLITERRVRIKIFTEAGYRRSSISIPYFSKRGVTKFKELDGMIYNLDAAGNIITQKLSRKDFFKEKAEDNVGVINFTFPNVKPGSVIEFRYTKLEKNMGDIDSWIVQDEIPTAYASITIITPTSSRVKEKIYGNDSISQKEELLKKGAVPRTKKTYYCENIRSFQPEPFMSSYKDNKVKVVFLLIPRSDFLTDVIISPESIWIFSGNRILHSTYFGQQIKKIIPGTEKVIDSAIKIVSIPDRIRFIYDTVKSRVPDHAEQRLSADDIIDVWNDRNGNTTEINLILLNLLDKAHVECYPLLVSTRENGKINTDFPSVGQLNGMDVLAVDTNAVFIMDASIKYQSYQNPPLNVMNRKALLLMPGDIKWVLIDDSRPLMRQNSNIMAKVSENGIVEGDAIYWYYDYAKSIMLDTASNEEEDQFFDTKTQGLNIISREIENDENNSEPLAQKIKFSYEPQTSGDFFFINPQFLFLKKENPFTQSTRGTDIDFGCNQKFEILFSLDFPRSYQIEHLPKNIIVRAPDSSFFFMRNFSFDQTHILLSESFEIKRSVFDKEEYEGIKEFFSRTYGLMVEEIVLKRKK